MSASNPAGPVVEIHTDGACSGNPGPGGWGVVLQSGERERELKGGEAETTNNRMELTAAIKALEALTRPARVRLFTDSVYLRDGITSWIETWRRKLEEDVERVVVTEEENLLLALEVVVETPLGHAEGACDLLDGRPVIAVSRKRRRGSAQDLCALLGGTRALRAGSFAQRV